MSPLGKSSCFYPVQPGLSPADLRTCQRSCLCAFVTPAHVVEPKYPGVVEHYLNLGDCYDRSALAPLRKEIMGCMSGYKDCYQRAYRCLEASAQIAADMRASLVTPAVKAAAARRAKGILSRELKKLGGGPGTVTRRFLSGVTHQGQLCLFETADALCKRIYELSDTYGLGHLILTPLLEGAVAAGYDVIACPSPMDPSRLEHLLIPALSLAFITSAPALPYAKHPYRRIRMDAMADETALRLGKARLRFSRKVSAALIAEAVESLAEAKVMHDQLEALYNPYVDFDQVTAAADRTADELSALSQPH